MDLVTGFDVDLLFKWPHGRAERLARRGDLPFYSLPDGSIRFARSEIEGLICRGGGEQCDPAVDQPEVPGPVPEDQAPDPVEVGGVHQSGINVPEQVQERGGRTMLYEVHFRDGSVGEVEASSKAVARRRARDFSDEPIDEIVEIEDDEEEIDDEIDDADDGDFEENEEEE